MIRLVLLAALALGVPASALEIGAWDFERPADALAWPGVGTPNVMIAPEGGGNVLVIAPRDGRYAIMAACRIALDPSWRRLSVSARMRATGLVLGQHSWSDARISVEFHGADGRLLTYGNPPRLRADAPWTLMRSEMQIPDGSATVMLVAANFTGGGECAFDDIRVEADPQRAVVFSGPYRADFSTVADDALPPGWFLNGGQQQVVDGALQLDATNGTAEAQALVALDPAWRRVRVTCRLSGQGLVVGADPSATARLDLEPLDGEGRFMSATHAVPSLARDADWHQQTVDLDLPAGVHWLRLCPRHSGSAGIFRLDDITCSPLE